MEKDPGVGVGIANTGLGDAWFSIMKWISNSKR